MFKDLFNRSDITDFLEENSYYDATEVQKFSIPKLLNGDSLYVNAPTGTGKTLSYALPASVLVKNLEKSGISSSKGSPKIVVVIPMRELSSQVVKEFKNISHHLKFRTRDLSTNASETLKKSEFEILVATPAKLIRALKKKDITFDSLQMLVLDEVDQLMDLGFSKLIEEIYSFNQGYGIQLYATSATYHKSLDEKLREIFNNLTIETKIIEGLHTVKKEIDVFNIHLGSNQKDQTLAQFLNEFAKGKGMIFCNTKERVDAVFDRVKEVLKNRGVYKIHGQMKRGERKTSYNNFKKGKGILVTSDLMARGIDITDLIWVLNYDLPKEPIFYLHRIGRTGRAKNKGLSYNFVTSRDEKMIKAINNAIKEQASLKVSLIESKKSKPRTSGASKKKTSSKGSSNNRSKKKVKRTPRYKRK